MDAACCPYVKYFVPNKKWVVVPCSLLVLDRSADSFIFSEQKLEQQRNKGVRNQITFTFGFFFDFSCRNTQNYYLRVKM